MIYDPKIWLKNYDKDVPTDLDIKAESMMEYIEKRCHSHLHRPAFNFLGVQRTYKELFDGANKFAKGLSDKGIGKGDVVAIHMPNIPNYLFAMLGALKAGCTITGISPLLSPDEAEHELNDCKAKVLVTLDIMFEQKIFPKKDSLPHLNLILTANVGDYLPSFKRFLGKLLKKIPVGKIEPIEGKEIKSYHGIVIGEAIMGANIFKDLFASIRDIVGGRSGSYEDELTKARQIAFRELEQEALGMGANAVVGIDLDYEVLGDKNSMLMVSISGTAVTVA